MLANIEIGYNNRALIKERKLDELTWNQIRKRIPTLGIPDILDKEACKNWYPDTVIVDDKGLELLTNAGFECTIKQCKGLSYSNGVRESLTAGLTIVAVPNIALYEVQTVTWIDDACTESIQNYLNKGWRILAICPPNNQRRPDYILGHTDKNAEY